MEKLTLKYKLSFIGALLIPCFGRVALHGTGNEGELYRYIVPLFIGGGAGFFIGFLADILLKKNSELQRINKELEKVILAHRESEQRYETLFSQNNSIILLIDPETGLIADANPRACRFYGYSRDELKQVKISQINTLPEKVWSSMMEEIKKDKLEKFYFTHRIASGERKEVEVYTGSIMLEGKRYLLSHINDISELVILRDIIPICASCKQIRDDSGYWNRLETYLDGHTDLTFSHGICPTCVAKLYPELEPREPVTRVENIAVFAAKK